MMISELKMKTQVEVEALQEQLRVRKEKQYQLLEKLQAQEEAKRQAEDQVIGRNLCVDDDVDNNNNNDHVDDSKFNNDDCNCDDDDVDDDYDQ